ncbi:Hypothetical predicted protein [Podarcis lilfordi]|uniref:Uncharacterized protein n=1 Tax=Podarcis lilfordi TaxID=74358 RepID=A0AA35LLZ8_9SAUR|nr:Hypothetical predicted protein [Podarcis lilfordi]
MKSFSLKETALDVDGVESILQCSGQQGQRNYSRTLFYREGIAFSSSSNSQEPFEISLIKDRCPKTIACRPAALDHPSHKELQRINRKWVGRRCQQRTSDSTPESNIIIIF